MPKFSRKKVRSRRAYLCAMASSASSTAAATASDSAAARAFMITESALYSAASLWSYSTG